MQLPLPVGIDPSLPSPMSNDIRDGTFRNLVVTGSVATPFVGPVFNVLLYGLPLGIAADGSTNGIDGPDAFAAISAAFNACIAARKGTVYFPFSVNGGYRYSANLPTFGMLNGVVADINIYFEPGVKLWPGAAVTVGLNTSTGVAPLDFEFSQRISVENLKMDCVNMTTAGSIGTLVGDNVLNLSADIRYVNCAVMRNTTVNGYGLQVKNQVISKFDFCSYSYCTNNILVSGDKVQGLPTVTTFTECISFYATNVGLTTKNAARLRLQNCTIEGSGQEAWKVVLAAGEVAVYLEADSCWFETNNTAGNYQILVDGSLGSGCGISIRNSNFIGLAKPIHVIGAAFAMLDNINVPNIASGIFIDVNVTGALINYNGANAPLSNVFVCSSPNFSYPSATLFPIRSQPGFDQQAVVAAHFIVNVRSGDFHELDVTTGAAFQVDNPINDDAGTGSHTLAVKNLVGGALGAATFDTKYQPSEVWVNPTAGNTRIITFRRNINTGKWQQIYPSVLVAN